jgi:hypothetical protein
MTSPNFDVREFARTARGSHRGELDLSAVTPGTVDDDAARLLRVLRDLESSTMHRMRNLLVTATHKDARVTAFLTTWAFEKFWIADALDAVLEASGHPTDSPDGMLRKTLSERADRRGPIARAVAGNFAGPKLVAAHVTIGLVDEWVTSAAYRRLAEVAEKLHAVVGMVLEIKDRHILFLAEEAERRLAESGRARRLTAKTVKQTAWPVGATERPAADRSLFESIVFGGSDGAARAAKIAAQITALPGLGAVAPTVAARLVP